MTFNKSISLIFLGLFVASPALAEEAGKVTDKSSPDYVRCKAIAETGSLISKKKICRTNAEWVKASEAGNAEARDLVSRSLVRGAAPQ